MPLTSAERCRRYRERHPERRREQDRRAKHKERERDPERILRGQRERWHRYRERHPETVLERQRRKEHRRRANQRGRFIEDVDRNILYEMYGGMCGLCKQFIDGDWHVDHIVPLSKNGYHGYINCQPAHSSCNLRKGNRE